MCQIPNYLRCINKTCSSLQNCSTSFFIPPNPRTKSGSMSGSLLSLLPFRSQRPHDNGPDEQNQRFLNVPSQQGKPLYHSHGARGRRVTGYERVGNSHGTGTKLGEDGGQDRATNRRLSDFTPVTLADTAEREATRHVLFLFRRLFCYLLSHFPVIVIVTAW